MSERPAPAASDGRPVERYLATLDHEELVVRRGRRSGLYAIVAVHSTVRGPALGGCRMWGYDDSRAAVRDALRLSRAMTFKSSVAGLPLGGGKGVIMLPGSGRPPSPQKRRDALLDFGETVASLGGRYITAEDVGTSARAMETIAQATSHVTGLSRRRGGSGDPSPWTALGVEQAILASVERAFGSASLRGRTVAIVGLGHVGGRLARLCAKAGAELLVSDIDPARRALADDLGARWVPVEDALFAEADVVAPCALGGVLDHETVPRLRCAVVAGAANNQLASDDIAGLLHDRGVLWAPDFVANAGGIVNISVELEPEGYDPRRARERVRGIGDTLRSVFDDAARRRVTPLAAAHALAERNLRA
ncbi:MAG TPA: Glu/Leu/Phe/Val dehydrogenase dimerization domain-containing protein [Capillimicrobium sp.]